MNSLQYLLLLIFPLILAQPPFPLSRPTNIRWPNRPPLPNRPNCPWGSFNCDNNNNNQIQPPRPTTAPSPTTTTPTTTTALSICQQNCQTTQEFNPVCGSDGINYRNPGLLKCAQMCGKDVRMSYFGACRRRSG